MITSTCSCGRTFNSVTPCNAFINIRGRKKCWICKPYNTGNRKALEAGTSKVCSFCKNDLPIDEFYFRASTGRRTRTGLCKTCMIVYNKARMLEIKKTLLLLRGGCCSECGYKKNVYALDFHHRDPKKKEFNIAHVSSITQKVLDEIENCDILCSNCHREHHYPDINNLL